MAENLKVSELKEILRENGAATTSNKAELIARLSNMDDFDTIVQEWVSKKEAAGAKNEEFENMKMQIIELKESLKVITSILTNKSAENNQLTAGQQQNQQGQQLQTTEQQVIQPQSNEQLSGLSNLPPPSSATSYNDIMGNTSSSLRAANAEVVPRISINAISELIDNFNGDSEKF